MGMQIGKQKGEEWELGNWVTGLRWKNPARIPIPISKSIREVNLSNQNLKETLECPRDPLENIGVINHTPGCGNLLKTLIQHADDAKIANQNHGSGG